MIETLGQRGKIDEEWAADLEKNGFKKIWKETWRGAEEVPRIVAFGELGGLTVRLANRTLNREEIEEINSRRTVLDLAADGPAYSTHTSDLLSAAKSQIGEDAQIFNQLIQLPTVHDIWLLPTEAVELVEASRT